MRRLVAALLMFALSACGAGAGEEPAPKATPPPSKPEFTRKAIALSCDDTQVRVPATLPGLDRAGSFNRLDSLAKPLKVKGVIWSHNDERVYAGVVCGARTAEQFATLVARSALTVYRGKPALHWTTRTGLRNFMWLERPGTAVYVAATPGLSAEIKPMAADISAS
ncbi:hypothetical protein SAMN05444920_11618 [Nonomuraea solani]|uniref:Lipoprotein n=1 Tax=Nonomuraea solani TaxID=1144553 RepID=A0A1H6EUB8_9ACTN|nr:hypothetical protein [Nonomuraea solani]SEH00284.1 hypothetical protein SAMN05444920_11618 [Nonomuraea solani]